MNVTEQSYRIAGSTTREIAASVEDAVLRGRLRPGDRLPAVRALARSLGVSPTTVAAVYRQLAARGILSGEGRRGTRITSRPPITARPAPAIPRGVRDVASGNPDPAMLPSLGPALKGLDGPPGLYARARNLPELTALASELLRRDGIPAGPIAIVGGAMDGIERLLGAHLHFGDRVAVEDPGYPPVLDLLRTLGLVAVPVGLDGHGMAPDELERALRTGAAAVIVTPRAQNPTGAALDAGRAAALRKMLKAYPDVMLIEDDHAGPVAGAHAMTLCASERRRWAVVRSVSKFLGPDLRLAMMTGDELTISRVEGRQALGTGWVSHILQRIVAAMLSDPRTAKMVAKAAAAYAERRRALLDALAARGIAASGNSGLNVWIPVVEEASVVQAMLEAGWAVAAGERYRIKSPPAIRISIGNLAPEDASKLADAMARALSPPALSLPA